MAGTEDKSVVKRNDLSTLSVLKENITIIDLSHKNLDSIDESIKLPDQLCELNLSHNKLTYVPKCVMNLLNLRKLDISFNNILLFDDTPSFCHVLEDLDISNNKLQAPPYWVWSQTPKNLSKLNISNNYQITNALEYKYFNELLQYRTLVKVLIVHNCRLNTHKELLVTFPNVKEIKMGDSCIYHFQFNSLGDLPFKGLDESRFIEKLNLENTNLINITPQVCIYAYLKEINLSQNKLSVLPNEFCRLENLEVCLLSFNRILYLPNDIIRMEKLRVLCLDSNVLCMLPDNLLNLKNLKKLDLYDNMFYDIPNIECLDEVDLAQNYFDEPETDSYLEKRSKIRLNHEERCCGRKPEVIHDDSERSPDTTDDEFESNGNASCSESFEERPPSSSSEDWDSDDWWQPHYETKKLHHVSWQTFVKDKMKEGNFCPCDIHAVPLSEKVQYEKLCNPPTVHEVPGQFDDYSEDDN